VLGLAAIFAAAKWPIIIMGGVLEVSKLVTASWLYQNWKNIPFFLKTYLTIAVVVLMLITSLGIFGFLSRAHIEQATPTGDAVAKIERLDSQILRQETTIQSLIGKIDRLRTGTSDTAKEQIEREQNIIENANNKIVKDVELITLQIDNIKAEIMDIQAVADKKISIEQDKLNTLDDAVNTVLSANKNFFNEELEAAKLRDSQKNERDSITKNIASAQADADEQIQPLRSKIGDLNAQISTLQASVADEIASAKARIDSINEGAITAQADADITIENYEIQINEAYDTIDELNAEKYIAESKIRELTAEVGPIKYIAQFFDRDGEVDLERAVTWLIIIIMFVFDPLAVLLLIAVNMSLKARYGWSFEGKGALDNNGNGTTVIEKEVVRDVGDKVDLSIPPGIRELEKKISEKLKKG
tara:strand:- start:283 stop:1530 length:1248 start_codon:yes stop_codon:yes gene_type:complete